jgi:Leucine Rich repeat
MSQSLLTQGSWFRPHLSTLVVASVVCTSLTLINIPGRRDGIARKHGWPLSYLHREEKVPPAPPGVIVCRVYRIPEIWSLTRDVADFRAAHLFVDVATVIGLTLVVAAAFEWYRRIHGTFVRFSLRTASVGVVVCSVFFAWIHYRVARWHAQRPAILRLESAGARIQYDSFLPEWIRELLCDRVGRPFDDVVSVDLSYSDATDADLCQLESLPSIRSLNLTSTRISDSGLQYVGRLLQLDWLSLQGTSITDRGLVYLQHLRSLECLDLEKTRVEGPGLEHVKTLHKLNILALRDGPLGDDGLQQLTGLPQLWVVYTSGTKITKSGANEFKAQSHNHLTIDYRIFADFGNGDPRWPGTAEEDPFR